MHRRVLNGLNTRKERLGKGANKKVAYAGAGAAAVIAAVIVGMLGTQLQTSGPTSAENLSPIRDAQPSAPPQETLEFTAANLVRTGAPVLGDPEAEVTIVGFSDFQCTNCRRFATQTEPQIVKDYVDQGTASIVFKHFTVFGPDSLIAGMASMCAHEQGKFWEFHDLLYANQGVENTGWANAYNMKRFASEADLDGEQFDACLDSNKYEQYVRNDLYLALSLGFPGTPSFIIMKSDGSDAEVVRGAQPYTSFKTLINKKLA